MINARSSEYTLAYLKHMLQAQLGKVDALYPIRYVGIGVGGQEFIPSTGMYGQKIPNKAGSSMYVPIPVLMIPKDETAPDLPTSGYAGMEDIGTHIIYWYKELSVGDIEYVNIDPSTGVRTITPNPVVGGTIDNNLPIIECEFSLFGTWLFESLTTYVKLINTRDGTNHSSAITELGLFSSPDLPMGPIGVLNEHAMLARHDCFSPYTIPTRSTIFTERWEMGYGLHELLKK